MAKTLTSSRLSDDALTLIAELKTEIGVGQGAVLEIAVRDLAEKKFGKERVKAILKVAKDKREKPKE
jgi:hypothetical protein